MEQETYMVKASRNTHFNFNDRILSPLEHITKLCLSIRRTERDFSHGYNVDELDNVYKRAINAANEIKVTYDTIVELIKQVNIKDYGILSEILHILSEYYPPSVLDNKICNIYYDLNDKKENLSYALHYIGYTTGIIQKYTEWYTAQQLLIREADIKKLDIKGSRICTMKPYWHDWYNNHIQDYSNCKSGDDYSNTWRERKDWEKGSYIKNPCEIEYKQHTLKIGMSFGKKQKIEIVNITKRNSLTNEEYELVEIGHNNYEYDMELIVIKHIGSMNDGVMQIMSIYELKKYAEQMELRTMCRQFRI